MSHVRLLLPDNKQINLNPASRETGNLRNELAPHFVINALVGLPGMIRQNQEEAIDFINTMAVVYRDILEMGSKDLVPLAKEIDLLNNYTRLMKIVFGESIKIDFEKNRHPDFFIVPVSLQILMENAIKHNLFSNEHPLEIRIFMDEKFIWFSNRMRRREYPSFSGKRGLKNLDARCCIVAGRPVKIEENSTSFTVRLPLIHLSYA